MEDRLRAIKAAFDGLPTEKLLSTATTIRDRFVVNPSLVSSKAKGEIVTLADQELQQLILNHFSASSIAGTYVVRAEEDGVGIPELESLLAEWQLIIDPIDGTTAFCQGLESWGIMVGLCDPRGRLAYSWNATSKGEVFSGPVTRSRTAPLRRTWDRRGPIVFDICDYGGAAEANFPSKLEKLSGGSIDKGRVRTTCYPAAVWTGRELMHDRLDGMLWLASDRGKCIYPAYDLVFLGPLASTGWKTGLGWSRNDVVVVVVAPTDQELKMLLAVADELLEQTPAADYFVDYELKIAGDL